MYTSTMPKIRFFSVSLIVMLLLMFFVPSIPVFASPHSVRVDTGVTLERAMANAVEQNPQLDVRDITRLAISGNGELTPEDGVYLREQMSAVHTLDLREFTGTCAEAAFRGCSTLTSVLLPEYFVMSPELFYGCSMLDELDLPVHYQISKDSLAYCALDFSKEYPSLLNDHNVLSFASGQRPKVYFTLPNGNRGTITAGDIFDAPYRLETRDGTSYEALVQRGPDWLLTRAEDIEISTVIYFNDTIVNEVDTSQEGEYKIVYSLPFSTYASTTSQTYYLTVLPEDLSLLPLIEQANEREEVMYTEESWQVLQQALEDATERSPRSLSTIEQSVLANELSDAIAQLALELEGVPEDGLHVGETLYIRPVGSEGTNIEDWVFDETYFSADYEEGDVAFVAQNSGQTEIVYTAPTGEQGSVQFDILEADTSLAAAGAASLVESETVVAGEYPSWLWTTTVALYLFILFTLLATWYYQKYGS